MWWTLAMAGVLEEVQSVRTLRMDKSAVTPASKHWTAPLGQPRAGIQRVDGVAAAKAWGSIRIDAPIEAVWQVLNDESRLAGRLPVSTSAVLSGAEHGERRVFEYMPLPIVTDRWWVVDVRHNGSLYEASEGRMWEMAWKDASPTAIDGTHYAPIAAGGIPALWTTGSWLLVDLGTETWLEYTTWADPGGSLPVSAATSFASGAVKKTLVAVAELAHEARNESRSGYQRPDGSPL